MANAYVITGLKDTGIHPRREIRELKRNDPIQFSLFIRAWNNIQNKKDDNWMSPDYYRNPISFWEQGGVHGRPYEQWSGDPRGQRDPNPDSSYGGYCYHAATVFPTWHRVMILLAEQAVGLEAIKIATELEKESPIARREGWVKKAKELRFPYWDWTDLQTAREGIPDLFRHPTIQIIIPGGVYGQHPVNNPLNHYRYPDHHKPGGKSPVGHWSRTYRWPNNLDNPTYERYEEALKSFNEGSGATHNLRSKIAALFEYPYISDISYGSNLWGYFSTTSSKGIYRPNEIALSRLATLEEPHNAVHINIAGNGTGAIGDYGAFEPTFYLLHVNVDRIFAFWEYIYPEYWLGKGWKNAKGVTVPFRIDGRGIFQQGPNSPVDADTPLVPFRAEESAYWTSNKVRSLLDNGKWTPKYYTYPPIVKGKTKVQVHIPYKPEDRERYRQAVYSEWGTHPSHFVRIIQDVFKNGQWDDPLRRSLLLEDSGEYLHLRTFVVIGEVPEFAFSGSYRLELYLIPEDPKYTIQPIDSISVFGRANSEECSACRERQATGSQVRGHIFLDPTLIINLIHRSTKDAKHPKDRWPNPVQRAPDAPNSLEWLTNVIKWSFGLRVVDPSGNTLASADPHVGVDGKDLDPAKTPRVTLHSHRVKYDPSTVEEDSYIPSLTQENGVEHGEFELGDRWKIVS